MSDDHADLLRRFGALKERFARVSMQLAEAGKGLLERRALPAEQLVEELTAARADFEGLRTTVAQAASELSLASAPAAGLRELESAVKAVVAEQARRRAAAPAPQPAQRRADEAARPRAEDAARRPSREPVAPTHVAAAPAAGGTVEAAQWWISASASWGNMKSRRVPLPDAMRDVLTKFPYVFSVPIQTSAEWEDGLLAYGYAVLLEFLEQRKRGFVSGAVGRLTARKGASLSQGFYNYLAESLQGEPYVEFIKAVMLAGLPNPGLWVNGAIEETEAVTTVFQRPGGKVGDPAQKSERLEEDRQRYAEHLFGAEVAPLTARFFRCEGIDLKEARDLAVRLTEQGQPSAEAWLVVIQGREGAPSARRLERNGSGQATLIRDGVVWIGVFNTNAERARRYALTLTLSPRASGTGAR